MTPAEAKRWTIARNCPTRSTRSIIAAILIAGDAAGKIEIVERADQFTRVGDDLRRDFPIFAGNRADELAFDHLGIGIDGAERRPQFVNELAGAGSGQTRPVEAAFVARCFGASSRRHIHADIECDIARAHELFMRHFAAGHSPNSRGRGHSPDRSGVRRKCATRRQARRLGIAKRASRNAARRR